MCEKTLVEKTIAKAEEAVAEARKVVAQAKSRLAKPLRERVYLAEGEHKEISLQEEFLFLALGK